MYKYVAAEVSALIFAARKQHPGAPMDVVIMFVCHDIHAGMRKHVHEMEQIRDGALNRHDTEGIPYQFNPAAACVGCTAQWCTDAALSMCETARCLSNIEDFDQYSLSIHIAHVWLTQRRDGEDPRCAHAHT